MPRPHLALLALLAVATPAASQQPDAALERARRILASVPLVDGHNDLPWEIRTNRDHPMDVAAYDLRTRTPGHTDLARLESGMVGAQFWSIYVPGEVRDSGYARIQLEEFDAECASNDGVRQRTNFVGDITATCNPVGSHDATIN